MGYKTNAVYYIVESTEEIDGNNCLMFGIVVRRGEKTISIKSLSDNRARIEELIANMNQAGLEMEQFLEVVDDFVFSNYGFLTE